MESCDQWGKTGNVGLLGPRKRSSCVEMLSIFLEVTSERQSVILRSEKAVGIIQRVKFGRDSEPIPFGSSITRQSFLKHLISGDIIMNRDNNVLHCLVPLPSNN
jgi:hypothetical protein